MVRGLFLVLSLAVLSGCAGEARYSQTGSRSYEIAVEDNGILSKINSSRIDQEWNDEAKKICPQGYTVQDQTYITERSFEPARLIGTISCR